MIPHLRSITFQVEKPKKIAELIYIYIHNFHILLIMFFPYRFDIAIFVINIIGQNFNQNFKTLILYMSVQYIKITDILTRPI